jgi:hypothetical protein
MAVYSFLDLNDDYPPGDLLQKSSLANANAVIYSPLRYLCDMDCCVEEELIQLTDDLRAGGLKMKYIAETKQKRVIHKWWTLS